MKRRSDPTQRDKPVMQPVRHKDNPALEEINALVALFSEGRYAEAATFAQAMTVRFPVHSFGWKVLGAAFKQMGRVGEALSPMQKAAALSPGDAEAHSNLGVTLKDLGRLGEAEASYRRALQIKPDYAEAHNNLGNNLKDQGRPDEAEVSCRRALQIKPDYAEAHSNLGVTLMALGRLDEAEASYRQALRIKPDYAEAHNNLGVTLNDLGRLDEAEASYCRALQIKPDYADAYSNLALLFNTQDKTTLALSAIDRSLQIKETSLAKRIFVACVKNVRFSNVHSVNRVAMIRALTEPWGRPTELTRVGIELVKLDSDIGECIARAAHAWPRRLSVQDLFGSNGLDRITSDPLLCALLDSAPICDIEMERFLTMTRWALLEVVTGAMASGHEVASAMRFYGALARQCFINEYVFAITDDELQKASDLRDLLVSALASKSEVPDLWPVTVGAYFSLCSLPLSARLLDSQWPEEVAAILAQQICEPAEEQQLWATISCLTGIDDEVSLLVQNQYEENPYPRWIKIAPNDNPMSVSAVLHGILPLAVLQPLSNCSNPDILIAGCGTGQQSIETTQRFQDARVLAVDLSMTSLSYAKRKTLEMGQASIEYAQADILKLGSLGRSFDVIESSGVLHHLDDPWAGWQVLLSLLRPGGVMKLGFYSEVARQNIVRVRNYIAEQGFCATSNEIRRFRQDLVSLDKTEDFGTTLKTPDFFCTSTCRDLLFHVQEHRMTLNRIDLFLRTNNLTFLGFEMDPRILRAYRLRFPDDVSATNLGQWQIFENENPDTFFGMYQFWIQKRTQL